MPHRVGHIVEGRVAGMGRAAGMGRVAGRQWRIVDRVGRIVERGA